MLLSFNAAWICLTDVVWKMQYGEEKKKSSKKQNSKNKASRKRWDLFVQAFCRTEDSQQFETARLGSEVNAESQRSGKQKKRSQLCV